MIFAGICAALLLLAASRRLWAKDPPLDRDEIRILRRLSDRIRSDQALPFD